MALFTAELAAACNALGSYDSQSNTYLADDHILETVKDLIRYLRRDTEGHEIRRFFGDTKILQLNLIPLLKLYWEQTDLFDVLLRLLGNLTSPVLILYNEEIPKEITVRNHFLQILEHLQSYKETFADWDLWAVLCTRLSKLLNIEWQERGEENGLIIERILILVRNVLSIPADPDVEKRTDNDVSAEDKVMYSLRRSGLIDIIHYMVSSDQEECYYMYLLEIVSLLLRNHHPIDLAQAADVRTESEKAQDEAEFTSIRRQEMSRKNERCKAYTSARHARFGGTFVFKNLKSVNDTQELIYHKALNKADVLNFDSDKNRIRVPKNRRTLQETTSYRRSTFTIRLILKDFCIEFLNAGYNKLMQNVRGKLLRGKSVSIDESYYLWTLRFFMEFNRLYKFDVKLVSETMSREIFHYVQQRVEHNFDMVISDKKSWVLWSKRLHTAVQAYKELLYNLLAMDKSSDEFISESSKIIKSNLFYTLEYRESLLTLMLTYKAQQLSNAYLFDLIETQHVFVKLLEGFVGKNNSIVVQRRQKQKTKKKSQPSKVVAPTLSIEESLEIKWDEISSQISTVLEGGENIPEIPPFDATSDVVIDEQKKGAMIKIQDFLRQDEIENAIGLLRSARDVWPDNDSFGANGMSLEEEFLAIRDIFFAKLRDTEEIFNQPPQPQTNDSEGETEEDEEEDGGEIEKEIEFNFKDFISRFASPKVTTLLGLALRHFDTNSVKINSCILKLLHRIAWDCKMPAMLFQASIFRTFERIFEERHRPEHKELVKFAVYIIKQFVITAEKNKNVFMELLFWKNSKEAYDIEEGYGSHQHKSKAMKMVWTEQEEDELRVLVIEYREKEIEDDAVDWIMKNLIDNTKTRRMIIKKLKILMLMDYKGPKKSAGRKSNAISVPAKEWDQEEILQLTELFNQFKDAMDPLDCIMGRLKVKRPKNRLKQKILELGLVDNLKALRKKKASKSNQGTNKLQDNRSSDELLDTSSSDENTQSSNSTKIKKLKNKSKNKKSTQPQFSATSVQSLITQLINLDLTESVKWLTECLTEAAEDLEQDIDLDDDEGVPIVAISEDNVLALDHSVFQKLMSAIGIMRPKTEQEVYWRIPVNIRAPELNRIANLMTETIEKGGVVDPPEPQANDNSSDDEDVFDKVRKFINKPDNEEPLLTESNFTNNIEQPAETEVTFEVVDFSEPRKQNSVPKKRIQIQDSDESDNENTANRDTNEDLSQTAKNDKESANISVNRKNKSRFLDESEDESVKGTSQTNSPKRKNKSRVMSGSESEEQNSDKENPVTQSVNDSRKKSNYSKKVLDDSDDSTSEKGSSQTSTNSDKEVNVNSSPKRKNKSRLIHDSKSEDEANPEHEKHQSVDDLNNKPNSKKLLEDSDDSESESSSKEERESSTKRSRESESESAHKSKKKKIAIIDSDDE